MDHDSNGATIRRSLPSNGSRLKPRLGFEGCLLALALAMGAAGCAANQSGATGAPAAQTSALDPVQQSAFSDVSDRQRLQELWQKRTSDSFGSDFTLGPGDVIQISVPLEQLQQREVRVSPRDTITLPLAGVVDVKGMTEQQLTDTLRERLSKYMYDPPISLFVSHYGSREVAVMGAVAKPDLYTLSSGSDTLMGMISKAGGMTSDAAAKVVFVPGGDKGAGSGTSNSLGLTEVSGTGAQAADANPHFSTSMSQSSGGLMGSETPAQSEHIGPLQPVRHSARCGSTGSVRPRDGKPSPDHHLDDRSGDAKLSRIAGAARRPTDYSRGRTSHRRGLGAKPGGLHYQSWYDGIEFNFGSRRRAVQQLGSSFAHWKQRRALEYSIQYFQR